MIRTLLTTTAVAGFLVTGAFTSQALAQAKQPATPDSTTTTAPKNDTASKQATPPGMKSAEEVKAKDQAQDGGHIASTLMGATVYNSPDKNAQSIGKVDDLVINKDGKIASVVVGVGGFLGIGSKDVAIDYSQVKWEQGNGSWWIVVATTADQLKALPDFDPKPYQAAPAANDTTTTSSTGGMAPSAGMGTSGMNAPSTGGGAATTPDTSAKKKQ
jgi:sporulation protein YlmC with PRC-barrel domain